MTRSEHDVHMIVAGLMGVAEALRDMGAHAGAERIDAAITFILKTVKSEDPAEGGAE